MCRKSGSSGDYSNEYMVDRHSKRQEGVKKLKAVANKHFIEALEYKSYCLEKKFQKYNGHISAKIAKWAKRKDVQMKSVVFIPSNPISMLSFSHSFKMTCDCNGIHVGAAM